jgi:hypothetical protein
MQSRFFPAIAQPRILQQRVPLQSLAVIVPQLENERARGWNNLSYGSVGHGASLVNFGRSNSSLARHDEATCQVRQPSSVRLAEPIARKSVEQFLQGGPTNHQSMAKQDSDGQTAIGVQ